MDQEQVSTMGQVLADQHTFVYMCVCTDTFCPHTYNFKIFLLNEIQLYFEQIYMYSASP